MKFAEFFAGVGLVRMGLEKAGWQCSFANDFDNKKFEVYSQNFESDHYSVRDIWKLDETEVPDDIDLFTASFPCVDLSLAGSRKGINAERSGSYWAIIDLLKAKKLRGVQPSKVLLENVWGFVLNRNGEDLIAAVTALAELGYSVDVIVVDAKHFTPQSRVRVFVLALLDHAIPDNAIRSTRHGLFDGFSATIEAQGDDLRPKRLKEVIARNPQIPWIALRYSSLPMRNTLLENELEEFPIEHEIWWSGERHEKTKAQMKPEHLDWLVQRKDDRSFHTGTIYRRIRNGTTRAELRVDGIAGCLRTPRGGSSKQIVARAGHGCFQFRWMTPREYARLQGVPDSYKLPENRQQAYFAMGDAVCVPAIEWIANNLPQ